MKLPSGLTEIGYEGVTSCNCWRSDGKHVICIHHQVCRNSTQHWLSHGCWRVPDRTMCEGFVCSILLDFNSIVSHLEGTDIRRLKTNKQTNKQTIKQTNKQTNKQTKNNQLIFAQDFLDYSFDSSQYRFKLPLQIFFWAKFSFLLTPGVAVAGAWSLHTSLIHKMQ